MSQICRLCLKTSQRHNYEYISVNRTDNNGVAIATLVKTLIPELYLGLSLNPVICQPCYDALRDAYSFRLQCLRSENLIGIYMRETHCSSMTIVLRDVIDYWMDVYQNKQCQTSVARANLEEWFGLDTSHIRPDSEGNGPKRKTKLSKDDEQDVTTKTTSKKRKSLEDVQLRAEANKNIEKGPEPKVISSRDLIEQLLGNYRVEVEEVESDTAEERNLSCEKNLDAKQEAIEKTVNHSVPENEPDTDGTLNTPSDSSQDEESQETCGCPPAPKCPSSKYPHCNLARKRSKGTHDECVILCEFRHLSHCKYFRAPVAEDVKLPRKKGGVKEDASAFPTPVKTYAKKTKTVEDEVVEKPQEDVRASPGSLFINEIDEDHLFEELQKCYNAGKFGFSEDFSNLKECFVLKKFYDKTDNSFSYALLPKGTETDPEGSSTVDSTKSDLSLTDAYLIFKSRDLIDAQNPEENGSTDSVGHSEGGKLKITSKGLGNLLESNNAFIGPSQSNPMPIIRVRPVSALQKVRTLNHELFPQSAEARETAAPRTVVMQPVRHVPLIRSTTPPVVLNSTIVSGLKNVLVPLKCPSPPPPNESLKTVTKTYSKPAKASRARKEEKTPMQFVHHVTAGKITEVALTSAETSEVITTAEEDAIDIKDEPLDYADEELSNELQLVGAVGVNDNAEWSGETTRSSSETSLMDKFITENISQLIDNIPDVGEQFDEPEYVHINKVSFADITKLVKESKLMKEELKQKIEKNRIAEPLQVPTPLRRRPRLRKIGKRVRIVPISGDDKELPLRKKQRTLVKTVERTVTDLNAGHKDVCVLFTNFTSEGDYINDHDYLINPYMRNNMSIVRKSGVLSCACLLCNIIHSAQEHITHMKCHGTKCAICQVDFHNVFILNLHARAHVSYCKLCRVTVTYSRYRHHAVNHNRLLAQGKSAEGEPKEDGSTPKSPTKKGGGSPNSPRRSRRLTRAINYEGMDLDEEEACIYDKATKSFLTPSVVKQEKLLEQCNDASKKTKTTDTKSPEDNDGTTALKFVNLADLQPNTSNINVEFAKNPVPQNVAPKKSTLLYSGRRRGRYAKKIRAERPAETPLQNSTKTETVESEESSTFETRTKRKKLESESENDDIKEASIRRKLSLRRRCPKFVPKNGSNTVPSMRRRRTKVRQTKNLSTKNFLSSESTVSDLAAAVDAIISCPTVDQVKAKIRSKKDTFDGKLDPTSLATPDSKSHESPEESPSSKVSRGTRSSRSRKNVNLVEELEVHRLARRKKARKSTSSAPASSNREEIGESAQPELPSSESASTQSPSVVKNTTATSNNDRCDLRPEKDSLKGVIDGGE